MPESSEPAADPHGGQPIVAAGATLRKASAAMILVHGRGAGADSILGLAGELRREDFAYLAPRAAGHSWYPYSFLAPLEQNEPWLGSALRLLESAVERATGSGIPVERLLLLGFSQGACLTAEFVARNPCRYGGVAVLTGGLIGPEDTPRDYSGSLEDTPVFLGTSDPDPHVPRGRVEETARVLERMGADVDLHIYAGMGHTVNEDQVEAVRSLMERVSEAKG